jgi:hypothetical protein
MKITLEITNKQCQSWKYFLTNRYGKRLIENLFKKAITEIVTQEANKYLAEEGYTENAEM